MCEYWNQQALMGKVSHLTYLIAPPPKPKTRPPTTTTSNTVLLREAKRDRLDKMNSQEESITSSSPALSFASNRNSKFVSLKTNLVAQSPEPKQRLPTNILITEVNRGTESTTREASITQPILLSTSSSRSKTITFKEINSPLNSFSPSSKRRMQSIVTTIPPLLQGNGPIHNPSDTTTWIKSIKTEDLQQTKELENPRNRSITKNKDLEPWLIDNINYKQNHDHKKKKIILVYTRFPFVTSKQWPRMKATDLITELDGSPCITNKFHPQGMCSLTYNTSQLFESDATVFHEVMLPKPSTLRRLRRSVPEHQIWIWNLREPPFHLTTDLKQYNNLFNWTCTYSPESEIFDPIFHITPIIKQTSPFSSSYTTTSDHSKGVYSDLRTKMIFVAINNCFVKERIDLIRRLKTHIGIDVYGRCGKLVGDQHLPQCRRFTSDCRRIMSKYRFYFAMENSYCDHYITEKYYENGLNSGLIPIVFGGADYKDPRFALQGSYINIEDFQDLKTLATYLKQVAKNDTLFKSYFWWKDKYKIHRKSKGCAICKRLWRRSLGDVDINTLRNMEPSDSFSVSKYNINNLNYNPGDVSVSKNSTNTKPALMMTNTGQNLHRFWNIERSCRKWWSVIQKYFKR